MGLPENPWGQCPGEMSHRPPESLIGYGVVKGLSHGAMQHHVNISQFCPSHWLLALPTPVDYICPSSSQFFVLCFPTGPVPLSIQPCLSLLVAVILCPTLS